MLRNLEGSKEASTKQYSKQKTIYSFFSRYLIPTMLEGLPPPPPNITILASLRSQTAEGEALFLEVSSTSHDLGMLATKMRRCFSLITPEVCTLPRYAHSRRVYTFRGVYASKVCTLLGCIRFTLLGCVCFQGVHTSGVCALPGVQPGVHGNRFTPPHPSVSSASTSCFQHPLLEPQC